MRGRSAGTECRGGARDRANDSRDASRNLKPSEFATDGRSEPLASSEEKQVWVRASRGEAREAPTPGFPPRAFTSPAASRRRVSSAFVFASRRPDDNDHRLAKMADLSPSSSSISEGLLSGEMVTRQGSLPSLRGCWKDVKSATGFAKRYVSISPVERQIGVGMPRRSGPASPAAAAHPARGARLAALAPPGPGPSWDAGCPPSRPPSLLPPPGFPTGREAGRRSIPTREVAARAPRDARELPEHSTRSLDSTTDARSPSPPPAPRRRTSDWMGRAREGIRINS